MKKMIKVFALLISLCLLFCVSAMAEGAEPTIEKTEVILEPTCTSVGQQLITFTDGTTKIEDIPMTPHNYEWVTVTKPTCTKDGEEIFTCHDCKAVDPETDPRPIEKLGHKLQWVTVTESTCTVEGLAKAVCETCGEDIADEDGVSTKILKKLDHTYGDFEVTADATCIKAGKETKICEKCGDTVTREIPIDPEAHQYGEVQVLKDPTCTENGIAVKICSLCGDVFSCVDDYYWVDKDGNKVEEDDPAAIEKVYPYHAHHGAPKDPVKDEESVVEATCTEKGSYDKVTYCSICGEELSRETVEIPKLPHTPGEPEVTKPTCTQEGLTVVRCTECEIVISKTPIPATGHDYGTNPVLDIIEPAKCEVDGKANATCKNCGQTYEVVLKALEHVPGEPMTVESTCDVEGSVTVTCTLCGKTLEDLCKPLKKLPHTVKEKITKEPTCVEAGSHYFYCDTCEDHFYNEETGKWTTQKVETEIKALGHAWGEWILVNEASDTTRGFKYRSCTRENCGYTENVTFTKGSCLVGIEETHFIFDGESKPVGENKIIKPAEGHKPGEAVVVTEPTCTKEGLSEVRCTVCQEVLESNEIPALGHTEVEDAAVEPTCTKTGLTAGSHCSVCGEIIVAQEEVPMIDHDMDDGVIDPEATPDKPGVKTYTCKECGYTETEEVPYEFGEAVYSIANEDLTYSAGKLTGVAHHDETTEALENLYVRVTFFLSDNTTVVTETFVHEDGTFNAFSNGDIVAISVVLTPEEGTPIKEPGTFETWENGAAGIML